MCFNAEGNALLVCQIAKKATYAKNCFYCGTSFEAQRSTAKFCKVACRVANAKLSPAHTRYKAKQKRRRFLRHLEYTQEKMRFMYLHSALGNYSGHRNKHVQPLMSRPLPTL